MKQRDYYLDNTKFFLIVMVILGHSLSHLGSGGICKTIDASVYFFHMPLFIFISGYFTNVSDKKTFWNSTLKLLETFLIFDIIHVVIRIVQGKADWSMLITPQWSLWYLLSLISWRIITFYVICKLPKRFLYIIGLSIIIGLLSGFIPMGRALSLQRTFSLLPFFVIGYYCRVTNFNLKIIKRISVFLAWVVLMSLPLIVHFIELPFKQMLEGCFSYYSYHCPVWISLANRAALYICCIISSVCVLRILPHSEKEWISKQGSQTLLYYLYHTIIIYFIEVVNQIYTLPSNFVAVLCYVGLIVLVIWQFSKIRFFQILPNYISYHYKK